MFIKQSTAAFGCFFGKVL